MPSGLGDFGFHTGASLALAWWFGLAVGLADLFPCTPLLEWVTLKTASPSSVQPPCVPNRKNTWLLRGSFGGSFWVQQWVRLWFPHTPKTSSTSMPCVFRGARAPRRRRPGPRTSRRPRGAAAPAAATAPSSPPPPQKRNRPWGLRKGTGARSTQIRRPKWSDSWGYGAL